MRIIDLKGAFFNIHLRRCFQFVIVVDRVSKKKKAPGRREKASLPFHFLPAASRVSLSRALERRWDPRLSWFDPPPPGLLNKSIGAAAKNCEVPGGGACAGALSGVAMTTQTKTRQSATRPAVPAGSETSRPSVAADDDDDDVKRGLYPGGDEGPSRSSASVIQLHCRI